MKRIEYFRQLEARDLAEEFFHFDFDTFVLNPNTDNHEKVIKRIMRWLNKNIKEQTNEK